MPSRRHRFDPWVMKIPWRGNSNLHQYSCLGYPMNRGAWKAQSMGLQRVETKQQSNKKKLGGICVLSWKVCFVMAWNTEKIFSELMRNF